MDSTPKPTLQGLRWARGLNVQQLAKATGLPRGTITNAETGVRITPRTAKVLAEFFEVDVEDIRLGFHQQLAPAGS